MVSLSRVRGHVSIGDTGGGEGGRGQGVGNVVGALLFRKQGGYRSPCATFVFCEQLRAWGFSNIVCAGAFEGL